MPELEEVYLEYKCEVCGEEFASAQIEEDTCPACESVCYPLEDDNAA